MRLAIFTIALLATVSFASESQAGRRVTDSKITPIAGESPLYCGSNSVTNAIYCPDSITKAIH